MLSEMTNVSFPLNFPIQAYGQFLERWVLKMSLSRSQYRDARVAARALGFGRR